MVDDVTVRANGIDLHQPALGLRLASEGTDRIVNRSTVREPLTVPGRHGSLDVGALPVFGEASTKLAWNLVGDAPTRAAAYAVLSGLLSRPGLVFQTVAGGVVREAPAELVSITDPTFRHGGTLSRVAAILALRDPFLRSPAAFTTDALTPGSQVVVDTLNGSTAPVTDAIVRFSGAGSNPAVTDNLSGTGLSYSGTIGAGVYLFIDAARMVAWTSASSGAWTATGPAVTSGVDYPPAGRLQLWPETTITDGLVTSAVTVAVANCPVAIRARRAYL